MFATAPSERGERAFAAGGRHGFTLLEVMVATAILALLATTVYGVLWRTIEGQSRAESRAELFAAGREAVMRMADELERALPPTLGREIWFVGVPGKDTVPNDAVGFVMEVRRDRSALQQRGGRAIVSYQLEPIPDAPKVFMLIRHEELIPDPLAQVGVDPTTGDVLAPQEPAVSDASLVDGVAGLRLRYLDPETGSWVNEWDTSAEVMPGQPLRGLPPVVEIQLFLFDGNGNYVDFSTRVDLPLFTMPPTPVPGGVPTR